MSPVYVPAVLIFLYLMESKLAESANGSLLRRQGFAGVFNLRNLAYATLVAWSATLSVRTAFVASQLTATGLGYNHIGWRTSETMSYLKTQVLPRGNDIVVVSNDPEAVYIHSGTKASSSPEARGYESSAPRMPVASIADTWPGSRTTVLVWFHGTERSHLFEVHELVQVANLTMEIALNDGTIYNVSTK